MFQSLGRDSVHSSISQRVQQWQEGDVSIPRSGFCSFKLIGLRMSNRLQKSFNPSVGILFIQAFSLHYRRRNMDEFQSLGRDSVHSSELGHPGPAGLFGQAAVSIPRSGFCSFKPGCGCSDDIGCPGFNPSVGILFIQAGTGDRPMIIIVVSIPRSGFCSFKPIGGLVDLATGKRFNPSVGILFIQA